jgi:hypothetical protein
MPVRPVAAGAAAIMALVLAAGQARADAPDAAPPGDSPDADGGAPPPDAGEVPADAGALGHGVPALQSVRERSPGPPVPIIIAPAPPREPPPPPGAPHRPMLLGEIKAQLRGAFIVNLCYNDGTLFPGSFAYYALPEKVSRAQFFVSPSNTVVGFKMSGLSFGSAEITGAMDVNLRSPQPLVTPNSLLPQFYDVHMQLEFEHWKLIVGQYPDVMLPVVPDTTNSYPAGYVPGALGYVSPQVRVDVRVPVGRRFQAIAQASINRPLQTFQLTQDLAGRQAGIPDVQGRVAFAFGQSEHPWERPFEIGVSSHYGRRRVGVLSTLDEVTFRTWSVAADLRLWLPTRTLIKGRIYQGRMLGDFAAGIFQSVNTTTLQSIRAKGLWLEVQQRLTDRWRATIGYGRDDPNDADLSPWSGKDLGDGSRSLNQEAFINLLWDVTKTIGFGGEASRWSTSYKDAPTTKIWRGDVLFYLRF